MNKQHVLETLVETYYDLKQTAKDCTQQGHHVLASHTLHQAMGVLNAAEALGITTQEFDAAYDDYRDFRRRMKPGGVIEVPAEVLAAMKAGPFHCCP